MGILCDDQSDGGHSGTRLPVLLALGLGDSGARFPVLFASYDGHGIQRPVFGGMLLIAILLASFALRLIMLELLVVRKVAELLYNVRHRVQDGGMWRKDIGRTGGGRLADSQHPMLLKNSCHMCR